MHARQTRRVAPEVQRAPDPEVVPVSIATVILSPRFQALAGPLATGLLLGGYAAFRGAFALGMPRPELLALVALGVGVAVASVAVTLGIILVVAKQTPYPRRAVLSIVLGGAALLLAGPIFLLVAGSPV